ncbi:LysR family transcriptional regulator [Vibrio algivorus]|uniref:LysR family transcriptional regulator n=1 Tax=Vibrio algivorus TaxID=1667024 RepID=A0A557NV01_9VIBR|nr:LysR family transcriptional regulator [Vibrio algivorus]TVO32238.1 LysR family transcriptional regulator [Vibrio algivorus]
MSIHFDDLYLFCKVAEKGTLKSVSELLDIPSPTLSRRIYTLEKSLGISLFNRNRRELTLTNEGVIYFNTLSPQFKDIDRSLESILLSFGSVQGCIRVSLPQFLYDTFLNEIIDKFSDIYPLINIELLIYSEQFNINDHADIAFIIENTASKVLISRHLTDLELVLVSSAAFNNQENLTSPLDLQTLPFISATKPYSFTLISKETGKEHLVTYPQPRFLIKNFNMIKSLVINNKGIALLPRNYVSSELASGQMIQLLPEWEIKDSISINTVYRTRDNLTLIVRTFIDFLYQNQTSLFTNR